MSGKNNKEILSVIKLLYDAAVEPRLWPEALRAMAERFSCFGTHLFGFGANGDLLFSHPYDIPAEAIADYDAHYVNVCPRVAYSRTHPQDRHVFEYKFIAESAIDRHEFYAWAKGYEGRYFIGTQLAIDDGSRVYVGFHRTRGAGHIEATELEEYAVAADHLEQAIRISHRLGFLTGRVAGFEAALDASPVACVLLDAVGRAMFANRAAETIFRSCDGLRLSKGEVGALKLPENAALRQEVGRALERVVEDAASPGRGVRISRPSGKRPYLVHAAPVRSGDPGPPWMSGVRAMLFILDPEPSARIDPEVLISAYGLTRAQARVALAIGSGKSILEIAVDQGISQATVRRHLEEAMRRTSTHRQSDLVRLVLQTQLPRT